MALTRRSLLSMLAAGIASVAVSTRLAASELKVVGDSSTKNATSGTYRWPSSGELVWDIRTDEMVYVAAPARG